MIHKESVEISWWTKEQPADENLLIIVDQVDAGIVPEYILQRIKSFLFLVASWGRFESGHL